MKILALEFSSNQRSAAVFEGVSNSVGQTSCRPIAADLTSGFIPASRSTRSAAGSDAGLPRAGSRVLAVTVEDSTQSLNALGLIDRTLGAAGVEREQIEEIAVGLGPGSYTGIRAAIALAQGWQLARSVRVIGVSSIECLVAQACGLGWIGKACLVIDAQRNEFYLAEYELGPAGGQLVHPLRLASREEARACGGPGGMIIGPEVGAWFPEGRLLIPSAATLAELAVGRAPAASADNLEPIYLREARFTKAPPPRVLPE